MKDQKSIAVGLRAQAKEATGRVERNLRGTLTLEATHRPGPALRRFARVVKGFGDLLDTAAATADFIDGLAGEEDPAGTGEAESTEGNTSRGGGDLTLIEQRVDFRPSAAQKSMTVSAELPPNYKKLEVQIEARMVAPWGDYGAAASRYGLGLLRLGHGGNAVTLSEVCLDSPSARGGEGSGDDNTPRLWHRADEPESGKLQDYVDAKRPWFPNWYVGGADENLTIIIRFHAGDRVEYELERESGQARRGSKKVLSRSGVIPSGRLTVELGHLISHVGRQYEFKVADLFRFDSVIVRAS